MRTNFGNLDDVTLDEGTVRNEETLRSEEEQAFEKDTFIDASRGQRENAINPLREPTPPVGKSNPRDEELAVRNVSRVTPEANPSRDENFQLSSPAPGVYSRFKRKKRRKAQSEHDATVSPERDPYPSDETNISSKRPTDGNNQSRKVAFDPIVREISVSVQSEPSKGWSSDWDTEPMKGIPLDVEKEIWTPFNSLQIYTGLEPKDQQGSFSPTEEVIPTQPEVIPVHGTNANGAQLRNRAVCKARQSECSLASYL